MGFVSKIVWKIFGGLCGVIASMVTKAVINAGWARFHGGPPPKNPEQKGVSWPEALSWTVGSAAGMAASRVVTTRLAAGAWEKATGSVPPGFEIQSTNDA